MCKDSVKKKTKTRRTEVLNRLDPPECSVATHLSFESLSFPSVWSTPAWEGSPALRSVGENIIHIILVSNNEKKKRRETKYGSFFLVNAEIYQSQL